MLNLENLVFDYLKKENLPYQKFAVALSGGADSMALYQILLQVRKPDLVIHVNHGMRWESLQEANLIKDRVEKDGINFRLVNIENFDFSIGNIEDRLRHLRYSAFEKILKEEGISHLFVGHQKEDAEETIFKRILEGSSLFSIPLFLKKKSLGELTIHRPLIRFSKNELVNYLKDKNIQFFDDNTNYDTRFLRARMRVEIFPYLNEKFGKNISGKFFDLASDLLEVDRYIHQKCSHILQSFIYRSVGGYLPKMVIDPLELKYVIKKILSDLNQTFSKDTLFRIEELALKNVGNKKIFLKDYTLYFEKSGIFFIKNNSLKINFKALEKKIKSDSINRLWVDGVAQLNREELPFFIKEQLGLSVKFAKAFLLQI